MSLASRLTALAQAVGADVKTLNEKVTLATKVFDPWHKVGAVGEIPFLNSWVAYDSDVYYRKDLLGRVYLRGSINGGANATAAFQLPVGYRPVTTGLNRLRSIAIGNQTAVGQWEAQVNIAADGTVTPYFTGSSATSYVSLDQLSFDSGTVSELTIMGPKGDPGTTAAFNVETLTGVNTYTIAGLDGDLDYGYEFYLMGSIPAGSATRNCVIVPNALTVPANAAFKSFRTGFYRETNAITVDNLVTDGIGFMFAPAYTVTALATLNSHATLVARTGSERVFKAEFEASDASTIYRVLHGTALSKWTDTTTKITSLRFLSDGAFTGKLFWRKMAT